jgi:ribosomal protein L1
MITLDDNRIAFIFNFSEELNNEIVKFRTGKALVEPTKFHYNYVKLLAEIRSLKNKQKWQELKSFRHPKHNW